MKKIIIQNKNFKFDPKDGFVKCERRFKTMCKNIIDCIARHKIQDRIGRIISYDGNYISIMLFGCDGFFEDKEENWMIVSL